MKKSLGGRLRELRGSLTQAEFARKIGAKQTSYSGWELDLKVPAATVIANVANALGVSCDWLLGLTDDRAGGEICAASEASATRIAELEAEVAKLRAVNEALMEAFANVGRGATGVSARRTVRALGA